MPKKDNTEKPRLDPKVVQALRERKLKLPDSTHALVKMFTYSPPLDDMSDAQAYALSDFLNPDLRIVIDPKRTPNTFAAMFKGAYVYGVDFAKEAR